MQEYDGANTIEITAPDGLEELAAYYLEKRRAQLPALFALLNSAQYSQLQDFGHNLKGTGESYGFAEVTRIGRAMEEAAIAGDAQELATTIAALSAYLGAVRIRTNG